MICQREILSFPLPSHPRLQAVPGTTTTDRSPSPLGSWGQRGIHTHLNGSGCVPLPIGEPDAVVRLVPHTTIIRVVYPTVSSGFARLRALLQLPQLYINAMFIYTHRHTRPQQGPPSGVAQRAGGLRHYRYHTQSHHTQPSRIPSLCDTRTQAVKRYPPPRGITSLRQRGLSVP
jgi:hypothetical protein